MHVSWACHSGQGPAALSGAGTRLVAMNEVIHFMTAASWHQQVLSVPHHTIIALLGSAPCPCRLLCPDLNRQFVEFYPIKGSWHPASKQLSTSVAVQGQ